ncbi:hypothetical protein [Burkholderia anthina]|uniref:hypothetical protein n=1 Tax=Burkholderia anthina TaxID=179879 RepID=UPI001AA010DD|nr:hypothetical protein [Burkholderia anthina]QTD88726.1 hypothetical protein J4G50_12945 [Burkholderia anthina]
MTDNVSDRARVEERLRAGDRRFSKLEQRLDKSDRDVREHLQKQDGQIADIAAVVSETATAVALIQQNTQSIIETWNEGARAVRFFCRLAQGWRFLLRQVLIPVGLPGIGVYAVWHYAHFHTFPNWISDVYKLLVAML